jgi:hypothetical protein
MSLNIDQTLNDMGAAVAGVVAGDWPKVKACIEAALQEEKSALVAIAKARLAHEIDEDEMKSQLDDEKEALQAALLVCQIETRIMAQTAANAAIKVLTDAIKLAVKIG